MGYQKQNFVEGQVLTAEQLNHIENGIQELEQNANGSLGEKATKEELKTEAARAKEAEQANAEAVKAENTRATDAEQKLNTAISDEQARAKKAEQELSTRATALESCGFVVVDGKVCMKYVKS